MNFGRFFLLLFVCGALFWTFRYWGPPALALLDDAAKTRALGDIGAPLGFVIMAASAFACLRLLRKPRIIQPTQHLEPVFELHAAGRRIVFQAFDAIRSPQETQRFLRDQGMTLQVERGNVVEFLGVQSGASERTYAAYNRQLDAGVANANAMLEFARLPAAPRFWFGVGGALLMTRGELWLAPMVAIVLWVVTHYGQRWIERHYAALIGACLVERLRLPHAVQSYAPSPADTDRTAAAS